MKRVLSKRSFKVSAGLCIALLVILLACASYFRIWSLRDLRAYQAMSRECYPVWRELHAGRIHAGQDVEQVIADTQPVWVERYGEFVRLNYQQGLRFTGVTILAKNGRLVSAGAWGCTWNRVFFNELTKEEVKASSEAYEAYWEQIRKQRAEAEPADAAEIEP